MKKIAQTNALIKARQLLFGLALLTLLAIGVQPVAAQSPTEGTLVTVAVNDSSGFSVDAGPVTGAELDSPLPETGDAAETVDSTADSTEIGTISACRRCK